MTPPPTLNYAPPERWYRSPILRRRLRIIGIVLLLAFLLYRILPTSIHRARVLWAQRQCLAFTPPATPLISGTPAGLSPPWPAPPPCYRDYLHSCDPEIYNDYSTGYAVINDSYPTMLLFMHERVSATGLHRLVVVRMGSSHIGFRTDGRFEFDLTGDSIEPGGFQNPPVNRTRGQWNVGWSEEGTRKPMIPLPFSMAWGEADPKDSSRFRLSYTLGTTRYYIHGQLAADGYSLNFSEDTASPVPLPGLKVFTYPSK